MGRVSTVEWEFEVIITTVTIIILFQVRPFKTIKLAKALVLRAMRFTRMRIGLF